VLVLFALVVAFWWNWGPGVGWRYMAPYRGLVAQHATAQQVIAEIGEPNKVFGTKAEFSVSLYDFSDSGSASLWSGGPVFMDYADPWHDGEGMVVYLAFDSKGRAAQTQLVGHANH
jgi:hypothetical protein